MTDQDIITRANANLWYLREADYLPSLLNELNGGRGIERLEQLEEMRRLGTVYPTYQVANIVSLRVRALLSQASLECLVSTSKRQDNA